jgi:hypothetical protein
LEIEGSPLDAYHYDGEWVREYKYAIGGNADEYEINGLEKLSHYYF